MIRQASVIAKITRLHIVAELIDNGTLTSMSLGNGSPLWIEDVKTFHSVMGTAWWTMFYVSKPELVMMILFVIEYLRTEGDPYPS
jgi:hypothetical protein